MFFSRGVGVGLWETLYSPFQRWSNCPPPDIFMKYIIETCSCISVHFAGRILPFCILFCHSTTSDATRGLSIQRITAAVLHESHEWRQARILILQIHGVLVTILQCLVTSRTLRASQDHPNCKNYRFNHL